MCFFPLFSMHIMQKLISQFFFCFNITWSLCDVLLWNTKTKKKNCDFPYFTHFFRTNEKSNNFYFLFFFCLLQKKIKQMWVVENICVFLSFFFLCLSKHQFACIMTIKHLQNSTNSASIFFFFLPKFCLAFLFILNANSWIFGSFFQKNMRF